MPDHTPIIEEVARYYSDRLAEHGSTAQGVDWNSPDSQETRFAQLAKLLPAGAPYSITDVGCGYGALVDYLDGLGHRFSYQGYDVAPAMVEAAREHHRDRSDAAFTAVDAELKPTDYAVASGIFNVKLDVDDQSWERYVHDTLDRLRELGSRGFAFNMLTSYSDAHLMRDDLYYADPTAMFDRCKRRYARNVALLHDYRLWEFTILVRPELD